MKLLTFLLVVIFIAIPCYGVEVVENGKTYEITGDYPNGEYVKQIKNKGDIAKRWSREEFLSLIPSTKRKQIWSAVDANEDIADWVKMVGMCSYVSSDMAWFTGGLDLMVPAIFTQGQVDNFLGR